MKKLAWCLAAAVFAGCGGIKKQELDDMEQRVYTRIDQKEAKLRSDLTGVDSKVALVQQLELKIEKRLQDMAKLHDQLTELASSLDAKATLAASNVVRALEFEEKLMTDRLAELRRLISELKKP